MENEINEQNEVTQFDVSEDSSRTRLFKAAFKIGMWAFAFSIAAEWSEIRELIGREGSFLVRIVGLIPSWLYSMVAVTAFAYLLYGLRNYILKYVISQGAKLMINIMMLAAAVDIVIELIWGLTNDVGMSTLKTYAIIYGLIFAAGGFSLIKVVKNSLAYSFIAYGVLYIASIFFIDAMESASDVGSLILTLLLCQGIAMTTYVILTAQIATYLGVDLKKKKDVEENAE
jgi:membrane protein